MRQMTTGTDPVLAEAFTRLSGTDRNNTQLAAHHIANVDELTDEEIRAIIARYEKLYGMDSEEFQHRWAVGVMPDTWETNDWIVLLHALRYGRETDNNGRRGHRIAG